MGHSGSKSKARRNAAASSDMISKIGFDEQTAGQFSASADSYGNLKPLPRDLLVVIFSMLTPSDLATLCRVSKGIYGVVCSNLLWKIMYERRWGKGVPRKEIKSIAWRELFNKRTKNNLNPKDDPFWDTLSVHGNDTTLDADFATHTWTLDLPPGSSYRAFRIIQTGKNKYVAGKDLKDEWGHVLVASGFEMYGVLHEFGTPTGNVQKSITYQKDAKEKKGVVATLGGYPKVEVLASSLSPGKYVENFISTEDVYVWTRNEKYSWFAVDLGSNRAVEPTHYTLRYGSGGNYCCPRNWLLQGTNNIEVLKEDKENPMDDPKWDTLKVHLEDTSLDGDWAVHTWLLDTIPTIPYRTFRVIQVGKNKYQVPKTEAKDRWSDVFVISGFEIYGTLVEKKKKKNPKERRFTWKEDINRDYSANMDRGGVITAIGPSSVKVHASSIASGKVVENFISKEAHHNWTQNEKYAWYAVDFGEDKGVIPTHYTLRYGSGGNLCCPRNWLLQATNSTTAIRQNR